MLTDDVIRSVWTEREMQSQNASRRTHVLPPSPTDTFETPRPTHISAHPTLQNP